MVIFQAPVVLGARALNAFAQAPAARAAEASRLAVIERRAFGDDLMTVYGITSLSPPGAS
jgi:diaminohydroxyphosphoribosylaminopyrimidine deaminase/5-amino-6-(5-phosphoribosylamino)uracil reductase